MYLYLPREDYSPLILNIMFTFEYFLAETSDMRLADTSWFNFYYRILNSLK